MAIENMGGGRNRYEKIGDFVAIYKRGGVWWMNYQNPDDNQIRKSLQTKSKKQAKLLALRKKGELQQGRDSAKIVIASIKGAAAAYIASLVAEGRSPKKLKSVRGRSRLGRGEHDRIRSFPTRS